MQRAAGKENNMKKKELKQLQWLTATEEMLQMAKEDIPVLKQEYRNIRYIFKNSLYIRASIEGMYLKIALFLPEHLSLEGTEPIYSLFIDKENEDFIGYDHFCKKWSNAMLDRIKSPYGICRSDAFCSEEDTKCIQTYFGTDREAYDAIYMFQHELRKKNNLQKHKRITDQWDSVMQVIPELPDDWEHWIRKEGLTQNFIFYEYNRKGVTHGYCTWCEKDVPVNNPKHNQEGECVCCHQRIKYKSVKKARSVSTEEDTAYLVQQCGSGFVVREFVTRLMVKMSSYRKSLFQWHERRRFVYDSLFDNAEYYYGYDRITGENRWIKGNLTKIWGPGWRSYIESVRGKVYKANLSDLCGGILSYSGFPEYAEAVSYVNPCEYLEHLYAHSELEKITKAGLIQLAVDMVDGNRNIGYVAAKDLGKSLSIDKFRLGRLRERNGGLLYLEWLRYEKMQNSVIADPVIDWMNDEGIKPKDLIFIRNYMSAGQVKNYLMRQSAESGEKIKDLVTIWEDYLIMAGRMGIDITDPIIYRARNLVQRHNELAKVLGDKSIVQQAEEIEQKYPVLPQICNELKKYEYSSGKYKILAPQRIEDILIEGQKLQHCIHKNDRYFERMSKKESYILFLRKSGEESVPYYTLEVEPNGTVRQKRTLYNRQLEDIGKAEKFILRWQKQLQKKLQKEDLELAKLSRELRIKEMDELRKNNVKLNGNFNGRLLADIMAEDLMEVGGADLQEAA